jgi:SPP1 family predicted phage head-tail adaptor
VSTTSLFRINAGKYRHIITFQRLKTDTDTYGEIDPDIPTNWENVLTTRASILPISGKEYFEAEVKNAELTHRIQLRFIKGIDSKMRVQFGSRSFDIVSPPINFQEKNVELQLMCKEREIPMTGAMSIDGMGE